MNTILIYIYVFVLPTKVRRTREESAELKALQGSLPNRFLSCAVKFWWEVPPLEAAREMSNMFDILSWPREANFSPKFLSKISPHTASNRILHSSFLTYAAGFEPH